MVYRLMKILSVVIRVFMLPSPFANPAHNYLAEGPLHFVTFATVWLFYDAGSNPGWGSFLYLVLYWLHTLLLILLGRYGFSRTALLMVGVPYAILWVLLAIRKLSRFWR